MTNETKECCECFNKIKTSFSWMSFNNDNNVKVLCMPHIAINEAKLRVNHCPVCGGDVRGIQILESNFN